MYVVLLLTPSTPSLVVFSYSLNYDELLTIRDSSLLLPSSLQHYCLLTDVFEI